MVDMGQGDSARDINASFVLFLEDDIWRLLIDSDAEPFQFVFDDLLVRQWLVNVQNNENKMASSGDRDDLSSTTFAILGTLDDSGQVEHLNLSSIIGDLAGYSRQRRELVSGSCRRQSGSRVIHLQWIQTFRMLAG